MTGRRHQAGASAVLIVVVLVLILIGVLAAMALSRLGTSGRDASQSTSRLAIAADALEQFAGTSLRLPCPADPSLDTGEEVLPAVGAATCSFPAGTIPWKTISMRRDDAFDSWGRKLSYRVYTGNVAGVGSIVRPGGASMVDCDTVDPSPQGVDPATGLCRADHSTLDTEFLNGKGLNLNDLGTAYTTVAFVVLSHGATGLGGYTVSGVRLDLPTGAQRNNTDATGPFTIRAFSDVDVAATMGTHFDDLLVYRTLPDLVKRANLSAREWPEPAPPPPPATPPPSVTFNSSTVATALGGPVSPGSLGVTTLDFGSYTVTGSSDLTFDSSGTPGIGVGSGSGNTVSSAAGEWLRIDLDDKATRFALTLFGFGRYTLSSQVYTERVEIRFYNDGALVGSPWEKSACNSGDGLASFSIEPTTVFNRVEIAPIDATEFGGGTSVTTFVLSEIKACTASETSCVTPLSQPPNAPNTCP